MASTTAPFCRPGENAGGEAAVLVCRRRILSYAGLIAALVATVCLLTGSAWKGNTALHTIMEVTGTLMAMIIGVIALVRFYTHKDNTLLFIGTGFIGTALLDGYHSVVTSSFFNQLLPSPPPSLIPWSWNASRTFLAVLMCLSWWVWRWGHRAATRQWRCGRWSSRR